MPSAPQRLCAVCPELATAGSRCARHASTATLPNSHRSDDPIRKGYKTQRWLRTRAYVLRRDPLCKIAHFCQGQALSTQVDHITRARLYVSQGSFYDVDNLQGACEACHSWKTMGERSGAASAEACGTGTQETAIANGISSPSIYTHTGEQR